MDFCSLEIELLLIWFWHFDKRLNDRMKDNPLVILNPLTWTSLNLIR